MHDSFSFFSLYLFHPRPTKHKNTNMDVLMKTFSAYPPVFSTARAAESLNGGGKILLPSSLVGEIANMQLMYPLQFRIQTRRGREVYSGVQEFTSEEGKVILPQWMFSHLLIEPGEMIRLTTVTLPKGDIVKLRPQKKAFIELSNPKAVLERALLNHTTLSLGTSIVVNYEGVDYDLDIIEMKGVNFPKANAILIIDCNLKVEFERPLDMPPSPVRATPPADFAAPNVIGGSSSVGSNSGSLNFTPVAFKPPSLTGGKKKAATQQPEEEKSKFTAFVGPARTLSGKPAPSLSDTAASNASASSTAGGRTLGTQLGSSAASTPTDPSASSAGFVPFGGKGRTLKGN